MKEQKNNIKDKLASTPDVPGVYLMKNEAGRIIYIGKAGSLKKRLSSYFHSKDHYPKETLLIKNILDFEYFITDSETEALILESTLIKKHKPKYNIKLKDDKRYPYIAVTTSEAYPRIIVTRKITNKNDRYFGPYTDVKAARTMVSTINAIFKLRLCKKELPLKLSDRPCLNFQMKKCSGLCQGNIPKEEYMQIVNSAISFLQGRILPVLDELERLMKSFSEKQEYEKAAQIRDIILDMKNASQKQKVFTPIGSDKDYLCVLTQSTEAVIILFEFRNGVLLGRKISVYENIEYSNKEEILRFFIIDYYKNIEPPQRIITQYRINDADLLGNYLGNTSSKKIKIMSPKTSEDKGIINMMRRNLDVIAADRLTHQKIRDKKKGLIELKDLLDLESLPEIMECFDISNIQGKNAVASMVRFREGIPDKSNYRRYKIRSYDSPNDPAMIHETLGRRLQYLLNEDLPLPDLIIIDGGKPQLNRALEIKKALEINTRIIAIAKKFEEIYTEASGDPIKLDKSSPALKIVQNIRDEAHRFAVDYHRKLRTKDLTKSLIDNIPNIGDQRKRLLLEQMGSIERIRSSSLEEISALPGIGSKTAKIVYDFFQKRSE